MAAAQRRDDFLLLIDVRYCCVILLHNLLYCCFTVALTACFVLLFLCGLIYFLFFSVLSFLFFPSWGVESVVAVMLMSDANTTTNNTSYTAVHNTILLYSYSTVEG